jgi:GTP-binding protein
MDDLVLELENYQLDLAKRERWLILNKIDLITKEQQDLIKTASQLRLGDSTIVKMISTVTKEGVSDLVDEVGRYLELHND